MCYVAAVLTDIVLLPGPMIRIIGDRLSGEIKAALLHTIGLLIAKAGPGLKPFVPQLQTTFLKCLGDQVCDSCSQQSFCCKATIAMGQMTVGHSQ